MRMIIVDDHEVVREGLVSTFSNVRSVQVVGSACRGSDALKLTRKYKPDVALVDWRLPDIPGDEVCRQLISELPDLRIIVLTTYLSEETVRSALQAGASAYVTKSAGIVRLKQALVDVATAPREGASQTPAGIVQTLNELVSDRMAAGMPSPHQTRVLELAAEGMTNRQIGERLFISESTVRFHMQKLKQSFSAHTRTELIAIAIRQGIVGPSLSDEG